MDEVILSGKKFLSSKKAAKIHRYTADYVGQLCRAGKLECQRIGRTWYVAEDSITAHAGVEAAVGVRESPVVSAVPAPVQPEAPVTEVVREPLPMPQPQNLIHSIHALHLTHKPSLSTWSDIVYLEDTAPLRPALTERPQRTFSTVEPVAAEVQIESRIAEKPLEIKLVRRDIDPEFKEAFIKSAEKTVRRKKKYAHRTSPLALALVAVVFFTSVAALSSQTSISYTQNSRLSASALEGASIAADRFEALASDIYALFASYLGLSGKDSDVLTY